MDKKAFLPIALCMRLISLHPEKQDIRLSPELDEDRSTSAWKIFQSLSGEIFIKNISVLYLHIDDILLEIGQEKELFGGERLSFDHDKDLLEQSFDYVFFFVKPQADFKRDRNEIVESEKMKKLVKIANDLPKELTCPICTNLLHKCMVLVPCLHTFCSFCLFDCLKLSSQCPLCRVEATAVAKNSVLSNVIQFVEDTFSSLQKVEERKELEEISLGGTIVRNAEGVYIGSCANGKKDGQGKLIEEDGTIYEGSWRNDNREGKGVIIWENGDKYDGDWRNDVYHGRGKYLWKNGQVYEGDFQENEFYGSGTMKSESGRIYQGDWKNGSRNGSGIFVFPDGDKYEGKWVNSVLQPEVKVEYSNGEKYEGEIEVNNFQKHGKGILFLSNGEKYEGRWANDVLESQVKIEYSTGEKYEGEIDVESLMKQGKGIFVLNNGDKYRGIWVNNILQPEVTIEYFNGNTYNGEINVENLQKHGKGVLSSCGSIQHNGNWINDKQHGYGILILEGAQLRYEGIWEEGKLTGNGVMTYADGTRFKMRLDRLEEGEDNLEYLNEKQDRN